MHFKYWILCLIFLIVCPLWAKSVAPSASDVEKQLDSLYLDDISAKGENSSQQLPSSVNKQVSLPEKAKWDFFGFIENENAFGISFDPAMKDKNIIKTEVHARLNLKYGTPFFYAKGTFDIFFLPISNIPSYHNSAPFAFQLRELYIGGGKNFQFELGKILYNWGTADFYSLTNYFDQKDIRELVFKEEDERYAGGTLSLHLKYLVKDYAIEAVVSPQNPYPLLPPKDSFWALHPLQDLPVKFDLSQTDDTTFKNFSYKNIAVALRAGGSVKSVDFHFSYFNGLNDTILFQEDTSSTTETIYRTFRDRVNKIGFDLAWTFQKLSTRFETVIIPDYKTTFKDSSRRDSTNSHLRATDRVPYMGITIGADYLFRGDYGRIIAEFSTGFFLRNHKDYERGMLADFFLLAVQDRFYHNRIGLFLGVFGVIPKIQLDYDFQNGLTIAIGGLIFFNINHYILKNYRNHDFFYLRARYEF